MQSLGHMSLLNICYIILLDYLLHNFVRLFLFQIRSIVTIHVSSTYTFFSLLNLSLSPNLASIHKIIKNYEGFLCPSWSTI